MHSALRQEEALGHEMRGGCGVALRCDEPRPVRFLRLRVPSCQRLLTEHAWDPANGSRTLLLTMSQYAAT